MTVIAVVSDGKRCVMAADSQVSNNGQIATMADSKVIMRTGKFPLTLLACDGSVGLHDVLAYAIPDSVFAVDWRADFREWLVRDLVPAIRAECVARGLMVRTGQDEQWPGAVLVARGGVFALLDSQGGVVRFDRQWHAIGSGGAEARGVLQHLLARRRANIVTAALAAVESACRLDDGCSLPSSIAST